MARTKHSTQSKPMGRRTVKPHPEVVMPPKPIICDTLFKRSLRATVIRTLYQERKDFEDSLEALEGPKVTVCNGLDQIPCPDTNFGFINNNIIGKGVTTRDPESIAGCECTGKICDLKRPELCACLEDMEDPQFAYTRHKAISEETWNREHSIHECNSKCTCSPACPNRVVQHGRQLPLELFKTACKGWGLRCPNKIPKGTFVACYRGEVITPETAAERAVEYDRVGATYLYDLDLFEESLVKDGIPMYSLDAKKHGYISRFFNHSCDPNMAQFAVFFERGAQQIYEIALFTNSDVPAGQELCFDYSMGCSEKIREKVGTCFCGSRECRGYIFTS